MGRAFDKAVRRKPLAGAADAGRYGNSIQQLIRAASAISPQAAGRKLTVGGANPVTLDFLVNDYVSHLLYHLRHIGIDVAVSDTAV